MALRRFFDLSRRYECLYSNNDRVVTLACVVPWEPLRLKLPESLRSQELRPPFQ